MHEYLKLCLAFLTDKRLGAKACESTGPRAQALRVLERIMFGNSSERPNWAKAKYSQNLHFDPLPC